MKVILPSTKIAEVIALDPKAIEAIASLSKPLTRLKNPILRKIMASRVTLLEASRMGNVSLEEFKTALQPLGFDLDLGDPKQANEISQKPQWLLSASENEITLFDVRDIIENGSDPLKEILGKFKTIAPGEILCVINKFIPTPLIHLLKQHKAQDGYVETKSKDLFYTYFLKQSEGFSNAPTNPQASTPQTSTTESNSNENLTFHSPESFDALLADTPLSRQKQIDVRSLEMPGPMEAILRELKELPPTHLLFVYHKRIPIYLLEELSGQNFKVHVLQKSESDIQMIFKHSHGRH
ncbi:DUF2249 domain-containing protein [Chryseobacterium sp. A321]